MIAEEKAKKICNFVDKLPIIVERRPLWEIRNKAIEFKFNEAKENHWNISKTQLKKSHKINHWMVNCIRHSFCQYDDYKSFLMTQPSHVEKDAYKILKRKVLLAIAEVYPELSHECKQQLFKLDYL